MENFVVSARKYRPSVFDEVVGQKHITDTLVNEINSNQLAQSFLFTGPRGVGKTTCARILAKLINQKEDDNPNNDYSFNIFELDAASNNSVDDMRSLIEQVRIPPQVGKYKVYIIDEVHMLSAAAFNTFLKTLEEPPKYAIFILATTERHKIIPTILSRCQVFNFKRIQTADMKEHLKKIAIKENVEADEDALHLIAEKADGGLRDCLSLFDQMVSFCNGHITYQKALENLNILDKDIYFKITEAIIGQNISKTLLIFDEVITLGFDGQLFLSGLSEHFRNLMVCRNSETHKLLNVSENYKDKYKNQSAICDLSFLLNALNINNQFDIEYKTSKNQRLHIELALLKLCHIKSIIDTSVSLDELKKKVMNI
ncbi:MAG: DNA polymerase III subunit gamma/tau [Bacteroidota bacterium]|nr:DNA polymerase III subunit gamma/tau [Bacteroidota bacterium]